MPSPSPHARVLFVDRPSASTRLLASALSDHGYEVTLLEEPDAAAACLRTEPFGVVLGQGDPTAAGLLEAAAAGPGRPPVILFDDFGLLDVGLLDSAGPFFETLSRPVSPEQVLAVVQRALDTHELQEENRRLRDAVEERFTLGRLVSRDPRMGRIFEIVEAVAETRASLLIQGESGTGKTMLARAVHERSDRADRAFIAVNCGALPGSLLESELFGHTKGAFTGAIRDREGKFEAADGGTLFLDEIGTASPELQVKLLRVLEEGRLERLGETRTRTVDVRLVAATNVNLEQAVAEGAFREDLYYRIHVVQIEIPPLRERPGDIPLLAERFLARFSELHGRGRGGLHRQALTRLCAHDWPGNVRELEHAIERAVLLSKGPQITGADLLGGAAVSEPPTPSSFDELPLGPLKEALAIPEEWLLRRALRFCEGNRQETARILGINRTTLFNKMHKYGLFEDPEAPPRTPRRASPSDS